MRSAVFLTLGLLVSLQAGCLESFVAERLTAPTNGGDPRGRVTLSGPGFLNGGGTLRVGPAERPATMVYWVMEPGPVEAAAVPVGEDPPTIQRVERRRGLPPGRPWLSVRAGHPSLDHDLVVRRPIGDAGPRPLGVQRAAATVFLLQGWGSRQRDLPYLWHLAGWLADSGCRVILPDLRAQGDSSGDALTFGHLERRDLASLADRLDKRGLLQGPLGVVGHSYGGAVAIQWAGIDPRVERIVAMAPYADGQTTGATVRNLLRQSAWPASLVLNPLLSDAKFVRIGRRVEDNLGVDLSESSPIVSLPLTPAPLLLITGTADTNVLPVNSRRLRAARPAATRLITVPEADHISFLYTHQEELEAALRQWARDLQGSGVEPGGEVVPNEERPGAETRRRPA